MGSAGDLDGDGFGDLVVWTGGPPTTVTVFRGTPQGPSSPVTFPAPVAGNFTYRTKALSAGDVNGDGYGDLLVGGDTFAQLFLGGAAGVNTTPAQNLPSITYPGLPNPSDARWPIGGGDFNGDGFPDASISGSIGSLVYLGDGHTLVPHPDIIIPRSGFGALAGDFNDDGLADLTTGGWLWKGSPAGPSAFIKIEGPSLYQGVGDINGDGFSDVLAYVPRELGVLEGERLYFGAAAGCPPGACPAFVPVLIPGTTNGGGALRDGGGLGDVNGDGYGDFAYHSPVGGVWLFLGSATGSPPNPSMTFTGEKGFGASMARL